MTLRAELDTGSAGNLIHFHVGSTWRLFTPVSTVATGTRGETVLNILWLGCWLLPLGYWSMAAAGTSRYPAAGFVLVVIPAGFLASRLWGIHAPPLSQIVASLVGLQCGALAWRSRLRLAGLPPIRVLDLDSKAPARADSDRDRTHSSVH
jgi:hypothetical protein